MASWQPGHHPGGRPTLYNDGMPRKVREYIKSCGRESQEIPMVEGAALYLGVDEETIGRWSDLYPEFCGAIQELKRAQKIQLANDGLYGGKEVNQAMAIFLLKCNHGMVETSRQEITGRDGEPLLVIRPREVKELAKMAKEGELANQELVEGDEEKREDEREEQS